MRQALSDDPDERAVRRASLTVGLQIAIATTVLFLCVVVAAFAFVLNRIDPNRLFSQREATIDIGGIDILEGAIIIGLAAVALAAALSWFLTRRAVRPLGQALRLQRSFVANASHELRTPLAVLDARLQQLERRTAASDPTMTTIAELRRDTATLVHIVDDLLEAADQQPGSTDPVLANPVVELAVDSMRLLASERGVAIHFDANDALHVDMPAVGIHRCVVALLDNALKFSPAGATVEVALTATAGAVELSVLDHGTGIRGLEPNASFDRFARGTDAGGRPGFGIGLALVRDTVERFGGTAHVASTGPRGTRIILRMPRAGQPRRRR
ncbi:HAMP domain-containing sensor histidine kinase [Rathayibacter sp. YIM 133350]|uniref:sensor histidine kinase n=1 Tax=Rathayibacter sp. YIM 133350 TaxID=3131992 RepID=UPI00307D0B33